MSEHAKTARAAMKAKAKRMGDAGDPQARVDASSWTPPAQESSGAKTGMRPISKRAFKRGGKVLAGGKAASGFKTSNFFEPTLMVDVPHDSRLVQEEVFGPALPVFKVKDLDEAIALANSSMYGLGSSIWTKDLARANKAANKIQAGVTWINSLHYGYDELPFGGVKMSGIGREHGPEALDYYIEPKGVVYAGLV